MEEKRVLDVCKCYHHHKNGGNCERCGITLEEALKGANKYCLEKRPHDHGNDGNIYLREKVTGWKRDFYNNFEKKYGAFLTEEQVRLRSYIHHQIASAVEEERKRITDEAERLPAWKLPNGSYLSAVSINKVISIINPSKE